MTSLDQEGVPRGALLHFRWPAGTAGVLCVAGPHAIPVSTAIAADDRRIVFALARRRETLRRIRAEPACVLCVIAADIAITAAGSVRVLQEELSAAPRVAALELEVEGVQDHLADGRTAIDAGVAWHWRNRADEQRDAAIRAELAELAGAA